MTESEDDKPIEPLTDKEQLPAAGWPGNSINTQGSAQPDVTLPEEAIKLSQEEVKLFQDKFDFTSEELTLFQLEKTLQDKPIGDLQTQPPDGKTAHFDEQFTKLNDEDKSAGKKPTLSGVNIRLSRDELRMLNDTFNLSDEELKLLDTDFILSDKELEMLDKKLTQLNNKLSAFQTDDIAAAWGGSQPPTQTERAPQLSPGVLPPPPENFLPPQPNSLPARRDPVPSAYAQKHELQSEDRQQIYDLLAKAKSSLDARKDLARPRVIAGDLRTTGQFEKPVLDPAVKTTSDQPIEHFQNASACSSNWSNMSGSDQFRICQKCKHHVYDFTRMGLAAAEALVLRREGHKPTHFYRRADGKFLATDCPVGVAHKRQLVFATAGGVLAVALIAYFLLTLPPPPKPLATPKPATAKAPLMPSHSHTKSTNQNGRPQSVLITGGQDTKPATQTQESPPPEPPQQVPEPSLPAGLHYVDEPSNSGSSR